ncbi:MAG: ABC transporter permease [Phycisphaerae bacterium]
MFRFISARVIQFPLILAVIYLITFALAWVAPGDPFSGSRERNLTDEQLESLKRQYNADDPIKFLVTYPAKMVTGDFGPSFATQGRSVGEIIAAGLPVSIAIGATAIAIAAVVGVLVGTLAAVKRGGVLDWLSSSIALTGVSVPSFVVAGVLLLVFAAQLKVFPIGGWPAVEGRGYENLHVYLAAVGPGAELSFSQNVQALTAATNDYARHIVLPAVALSLLPMAYITRLTRVSMMDVLGSDYVRTARAKGLSKLKVIFKHCLRNAALPVLSFLGPAAANVLVGSFVVETVFAIPGLGSYFVSSVIDRDQTLILGTVMVYSVLLLSLNLAVDVMYSLVDPRIELTQKGASA